MDSSFIAFLPFFLCGLVFSIIGICMSIYQKNKEKKCTEKAKGKVIELVKNYSRNDMGNNYTIMWHPVIEYYIGEITVKKQSAYGRSSPKYFEGQEIEVFYNPNDYNQYFIIGDSTGKLLSTIFIILGFCFTVIPLILYIALVNNIIY